MTQSIVAFLVLSVIAVTAQPGGGKGGGGGGGGGGALTSCGDKSAGPVLNGTDLVATYKAAAKGEASVPVIGSKQYSFTDKEGFSFWFSSAANKEEYAADPSKFPVGAGGYCGLAVSGNDPMCSGVCPGPACLTQADTHQIGDDGKLYFYLGSGAMRIFNQNKTGSEAGCATSIAAVEKLQGHTCWNTDNFRCHGPKQAAFVQEL